MANYLIIDDEEALARNTARYLARHGHDALTAGSVTEGLQSLRDRPVDAVVLDYRLPDGTGLDFIRRLRAVDADTPVVLVTGYGTIELAVEAMKAGATDLLTKPVPMEELRRRLEELGQRQRDRQRLQYFEQRQRSSASEILGDHPTMEALRERVRRVAAVHPDGMAPPVLILGETGCGKELVAKACHSDGPRAAQPFIEVNCAAIPRELLESELFGHEKGAFTDARERKIGLIEAADEGSLFLDEIGDMDLALQAKLLKVLEDGRFRRLGSVQERQVNVRILAATNQDLEQRVAAGAFRADLYFRLKVLQVQIPPLRERGDDALLLAQHFLAQSAQRYRRTAPAFRPEALAAIRRHRWPGNVRELRNLMEQAVLLCAGDAIDVGDLMLPTASEVAPTQADGAVPTDGGGSSLIERMERQLLVQALEDSGHNVSQAARVLGISRDTLRYRMEKHRLKAGV